MKYNLSSPCANTLCYTLFRRSHEPSINSNECSQVLETLQIPVSRCSEPFVDWLLRLQEHKLLGVTYVENYEQNRAALVEVITCQSSMPQWAQRLILDVCVHCYSGYRGGLTGENWPNWQTALIWPNAKVLGANGRNQESCNHSFFQIKTFEVKKKGAVAGMVSAPNITSQRSKPLTGFGGKRHTNMVSISK